VEPSATAVSCALAPRGLRGWHATRFETPACVSTSTAAPTCASSRSTPPNLRIIALDATDLLGGRGHGKAVLEELCEAKKLTPCVGLVECDGRRAQRSPDRDLLLQPGWPSGSRSRALRLRGSTACTVSVCQLCLLVGGTGLIVLRALRARARQRLREVGVDPGGID